jgi:DNA-binding CsgD family transcriptional regulator
VEAPEGTQDVQSSALDRLSQREREVLRLASGGSTNQEIGVHLGLSVHAVKFHLASVYRKLEVSNRTEAAVVMLTGGRSGTL